MACNCIYPAQFHSDCSDLREPVQRRPNSVTAQRQKHRPAQLDDAFLFLPSELPVHPAGASVSRGLLQDCPQLRAYPTDGLSPIRRAALLAESELDPK